MIKKKIVVHGSLFSLVYDKQYILHVVRELIFLNISHTLDNVDKDHIDIQLCFHNIKDNHRHLHSNYLLLKVMQFDLTL
jgi:hypothetical protein